MTDAQLIAFINQWVYTNGNNEITAATLNPVLQAIRERQNDVTGDADDLATTDQTNLVAAINEIYNLVNNSTSGGVNLYTGTADPNVTPPITFSYADFYMMVDEDNLPLQLFQYDGFTWVNGGATIIINGAGTTVTGNGSSSDPYQISADSGFESLQEMYDDNPDNTKISDGDNSVSLIPAGLITDTDIISSNAGSFVGTLDVTGAQSSIVSEPRLGGGVTSHVDLLNEYGKGSSLNSEGLLRIGVNNAGFSSSLFVNNITQGRNNEMPDRDGVLAASVKIGSTSYVPDDSGEIDLTSAIPTAITIDPIPTDGSSNAVSSNGVFDSLYLKSNINSPAFTGTPTAPTASTITSDTQISTTAHAHAVADAKITQTITNGVTSTAPSEDAVFDALALKQPIIQGASGILSIGTSGQLIRVNSAGTALEYYTPAYPKKINADSSSITGTTSEGILYSITVNGGDFVSGSNDMCLFANFKKTGTSAACTLRFYINTANTLSGATMIAMHSPGAANLTAMLDRTFFLRTGNLIDVFPPAQAAVTDRATLSTTARSLIALDPSVTFYILITGQLGNASDSILCSGYLLERK